MTQFEEMIEELRAIREMLQILVEALPERPVPVSFLFSRGTLRDPCHGCGRPLDHIGPSVFCVACDAERTADLVLIVPEKKQTGGESAPT